MIERHIFIDEQAAVDLTFGAIRQADTWELLRDALRRWASFLGADVDAVPARPCRWGGISLRG